MAKPVILILEWMPDGTAARLEAEFPQCDFVDGRNAGARDRLFKDATVTYGLPPVEGLSEATSLRWIQLFSAGVPQDLCPPARARGLTVTNLAGLYGPAIAEHALGMMLILSRDLHVIFRNQMDRRWDRAVAPAMADLHEKTLAVIGLGNIGQNIARLARGLGMRVIGCRRTARPTPFVDRLFGAAELGPMLGEADYVAVAAPLTAQTEGMLGAAEFAAMKAGAIYVNVSRGGIAQEKALTEALRTGKVAAAGLDVFAAEPLPPDHPFWTMSQVLISPHVSGETVNLSSLPAERFARNLTSWLAGKDLEGRVDLELGY